MVSLKGVILNLIQDLRECPRLVFTDSKILDKYPVFSSMTVCLGLAGGWFESRHPELDSGS
ncbi:hypothetical protein AB4262_15985 [Vibrio breoganii]|uniref:hypothetical protein n=1 Tax=Vibrio breoganii TaxID=553239 RepID=UPI001054E048|nr:hypothetical protein [Vibrio breoganii]